MQRAAADSILVHNAYPNGLTRDDILSWYRAGRARTRQIFAIPAPDAYYERPIELRNPIVFYDGHLPAFAVNTLVKFGHHKRGVDEKLEVLFARGIDPDSAAHVDESSLWPDRETVRRYVAAADALIEKTLLEEPIVDEPTVAILEHEQMHQETFLYMLHNLPHDRKSARWSAGIPSGGKRVDSRRIRIPAGNATLGNDGGFGWDNEFPAHSVHVDAFEIDQHSVTNGAYLDYMNATGAPAPHFWAQRDGHWLWRGMLEWIVLPLDWPVYVTYDEAAAYAKWAGGRVPTEPEYHRAAFGTPSGAERRYPWGNELPDATRGNFDFHHFEPSPAGSYPRGASAWGVHDLVGNGWEWTSTIFAGFDGFKPMASYPNYSADFFDGEHYVLKGASPVTARELVRRSFRNWFRPNYPYLYAKFRCAW